MPATAIGSVSSAAHLPRRTLADTRYVSCLSGCHPQPPDMVAGIYNRYAADYSRHYFIVCVKLQIDRMTLRDCQIFVVSFACSHPATHKRCRTQDVGVVGDNRIVMIRFMLMMRTPYRPIHEVV